MKTGASKDGEERKTSTHHLGPIDKSATCDFLSQDNYESFRFNYTFEMTSLSLLYANTVDNMEPDG